MDAAKKKALSPAGLAVLRFMLLLVVTLFLPQTRVWGVEAAPQHASGKIAFASASAIGVIAPVLAYDASDCRVAADTTFAPGELMPNGQIAGMGPGAAYAGELGNNGASFASESQLLDHFARHGADFGASSAAEYEGMASDFLTGDLPDGVLEGTRANGDVVRFNPATNEFGVIKGDGLTIKTYYVPDPAVHGFPTNLDYFNGQF